MQESSSTQLTNTFSVTGSEKVCPDSTGLDFPFLSLDAARIGAWDMDLISGIVRRNVRHDQLFGYDGLQGSWSMQTAMAHIVPEDKPVFSEAFERMYRTSSLSVEVRVLQPDNTIRWVNVIGHVFYDDKGTPLRAAGVVFDITERKILEKKKDEFIGIASHELKTPATSIHAYTQILYNEFVETHDQRSAQLVSKLNNQVARLTNLAKHLLDLTKITQGQLLLKEDYFDVPSLIAEIIEELQRTTPHLIAVAPISPLPLIWGDRERIGQVLINLISNAIKYSPESEPVTVGVSATEKYIRIWVQDAGIGMSQEVQERVFERFFRSNDPAATRYPGLGLGLYIAQEIVRAHGGSITVDSKKGEGSVFTFYLPLRKPAG
jgi:signal transduction histidine kinase